MKQHMQNVYDGSRLMNKIKLITIKCFLDDISLDFSWLTIIAVIWPDYVEITCRSNQNTHTHTRQKKKKKFCKTEIHCSCFIWIMVVVLKTLPSLFRYHSHFMSHVSPQNSVKAKLLNVSLCSWKKVIHAINEWKRNIWSSIMLNSNKRSEQKAR